MHVGSAVEPLHCKVLVTYGHMLAHIICRVRCACTAKERGVQSKSTHTGGIY